MGFPNVPNLPGVPPLPRPLNLSAPLNQVLGFGVAQAWRAISNKSQWGVYDKNDKPLFNAEDFKSIPKKLGFINSLSGIKNEVSTLSVDYSKGSRVSSFPLENGGFAAYNKVEIQASATVVLCLGGSVKDRELFLGKIDEAVKSTDLYKIWVPEKKYINYSIDNYSYSRSSENGTHILVVTLDISEQRFVTSQKTKQETVKTNPKKPEGKSTKDSGKVQANSADKSILLKASQSPTLKKVIDSVAGFFK